MTWKRDAFSVTGRMYTTTQPTSHWLASCSRYVGHMSVHVSLFSGFLLNSDIDVLIGIGMPFTYKILLSGSSVSVSNFLWTRRSKLFNTSLQLLLLVQFCFLHVSHSMISQEHSDTQITL